MLSYWRSYDVSCNKAKNWAKSKVDVSPSKNISDMLILSEFVASGIIIDTKKIFINL